MPNIRSKANGQNKKILPPNSTKPQKLCNYFVEEDCPINGLCLRSSILYQVTIKCSKSKCRQKRYKGICKMTLKKHANHKKSFNLIKSKNDTTLSTKYWTLKLRRLTLEMKGNHKAYNPNLKKCNLCLNEMLAIIDDPDKNLLKRSKVIFQCRHRNKFKLANLTSHKTTNDVTE